ncbi:MAG: AAA family ATPase [Deltaproteobacteria bacterium]|nr:AAA family ATPase [Candidatus Tharpella aukensis]
MSNRWNFPGSKWWKFDFHTHTPASDDYEQKNINEKTWLQHAMQAGLDCVVVTDHNSGGWIDKLKTKNRELRDQTIKPDWFRELTIFPGAEITVADSSSRVHLLAVFDPSCNSQKVTAVLGKCGIDKGFGDNRNTATTTSFGETVNIITAAGGIAIPAHIDGKQGLLEEVATLSHELEKSLEAIFVAEFCDLHKFDQSEFSLKRKVNLLAQVVGSDAHKPEEIGRICSWLKMSRPSIEGLKLALMDHEYCVKNQPENPNRLPDIFLLKLTIKDMRHCGRINGQPFEMQMNPHFNAIIGGRGTGKSTVLESIRIVSRRDQNLAAEAPRVKGKLDKFMKLSHGREGVMLKKTELLLEVHRRGKNYQLRWRYDSQGVVLEEQAADGWQTVKAGDLKERFPLSIFSQKQIDELATNPRGLLEVIDRAPEVNRAEWLSRWESTKSQFLQLRERRRELLRQLFEEEQIRAKLKDVESDLKQYEEKGHGEILKQYQKRSQQKNSLPDDKIFDDLASSIRRLASTAELSDFPDHLFDDQDETTAEIRAIHQQSVQELEKISESLVQLAESVDTLKTQRKTNIAASKWNQVIQSSIVAYEGLIKEYQEKQSQLSISVYGNWVQQRNQLQQQLHKLVSVRQEVQAIEKQIDETLKKLLDLRTELLEKRRNFLDQVIGSSAFVRMELIQFGDVNSLEDDYRSLLNLDAGKFISSVYDRESEQGLLWPFYNWEESQTAESNLPQLIVTIKSQTKAIAEDRSSGKHGNFDNRLKKLYANQPAVFDQLDTWWPEDRLRVKYSKNPSSGKFDDLEKGSAGQKAAAILAFLLSHGSEPLIIDQPEDDLDNALIYDLIVSQIHENKDRRQLIVVTHNPNIVVNGDSELVHILKFEKGQVQIDHQGGLEEANIREAICTIMEGGRKAFDKRYKRITLEI